MGGGYTGLSAALHLRQAGVDAVLLEAHRVGFGASGRNGGQMSGGQRVGVLELEASFGLERAQLLFEEGEAAKRLVLELMAASDIACELRPGLLEAEHRCGRLADLERETQRLQTHYGRGNLRFLNREACRAAVSSPLYVGGAFDPEGYHLNPLAFALGLAAAAVERGLELFEGTAVSDVQRRGALWAVSTDAGEVLAERVILAGNGYLQGISPDLDGRFMPINNFIVATEVLGAERAQALLPDDAAVSDLHFVVRYFRRTADHRLLFGGGESYGWRFPKNIGHLVRPLLEETFPQLQGVRFDYAWGGTLAITRTRLPFLAELAPGLSAACGYSGHGVALATLAGRTLARAALGEMDDLARFAGVSGPAFPGGHRWRRPLLVAGMGWYAMRDRLGL